MPFLHLIIRYGFSIMVFSVACAERRSLSLAVYNRLDFLDNWHDRDGLGNQHIYIYRLPLFPSDCDRRRDPFSHDVRSAILVSQNNETEVTLALRVERFSYVCITAGYVNENAP